MLELLTKHLQKIIINFYIIVFYPRKMLIKFIRVILFDQF